MSNIAQRRPRTTTLSLHTVRTVHDDGDRPCFRRKTGFIYSLNAAFCCKGLKKISCERSRAKHGAVTQRTALPLTAATLVRPHGGGDVRIDICQMRHIL